MADDDPLDSPLDDPPDSPSDVYAARLAHLVLCRRELNEEEGLLLREVFPGIYGAHHALVWNQLRRRGLDRFTAEDLVQDTFETLFTQILRNGFPDSLPPYLHTIAEHKLLNHVRDHKRSPFSVGLPSSGSEPVPSAPEAERTIDLAAVVQQMRAEVSDAQWAVVELVLVARLPYEEAAAKLDIPIPTLRKRLLAAKTVLKRLVKRLLPPSQRPAEESSP